MRNALWLLLALGADCKRKPAAPVVDNPVVAPPQTVAENPPPAEPYIEEGQPIAPPAAPSTAGHAPTAAELRAKLEPLYNAIGNCATQNGMVAAGPKYLLLRFAVAPATGNVFQASLDGHAPADACLFRVLQSLHFEVWSGDPTVVRMPLSRDGKPVLESAFTDGGV